MPFEADLLGKAPEIPRGQVRPYAWVARESGGQTRRAPSARAGAQPRAVPLLVPCHCVVRSNGNAGEYALGASRKLTMLGTEGVDVASLAREARSELRFHGLQRR